MKFYRSKCTIRDVLVNATNSWICNLEFLNHVIARDAYSVERYYLIIWAREQKLILGLGAPRLYRLNSERRGRGALGEVAVGVRSGVY